MLTLKESSDMKTLNQINEQSARIICAITRTNIPIAEQVKRMKKVSSIASKYRQNVSSRLADLNIADERWGTTLVSREIYTK